MLVIAAAGHVAAVYAACLLGLPRLLRATVEDGFFENLTALYLLAGACLFLALFVSSPRRNVFHLLLGLVILFGFLEEISWGQRILNLQTPAWFAEHSVKSEINLHNLKWLSPKGDPAPLLPPITQITAGRLSRLFWFAFCLGIPLLHRAGGRARRAIEQIRLPVVPMSIGLLFLANYGALLALVLRILPAEYIQPLSELHETNLGWLWLCVAIAERLRVAAGRQKV